jgi:DNA-binding beta-propeller fold protein YncE
MRPISSQVFALLLTVLATNLNAADLLVAMSGGGTVERYDSVTGKHVGTFISRIERPNALAFGPDGALYVASGAVGGPGAVKKFHGVTGRLLGDFISVPAGHPGYLARASDIIWHEGDCFVVSCDDSKVQRYDGKTGAFKGTVATGNPAGWITQIAVRDGALFTTEFNEGRVRRIPLAGGDSEVFVEQAGFTPWGIVFDQGGRCWWSGSGGIARFDGTTNAVVVPEGEVATPVALALSPEGQLVCSSNGLQSVTVWDITEETPKLLRTITGPEVRDPAGVAFTTQPFEAPAQFGNFVPQPSNTGRDWTPTGTTIYNLRADAAFPVIAELGLDTEGGDRAKTQLLREPMRLVFTLADGRQVDAWDVPAKRQLSPGKVEYQFSPAEGIDARWSVWTDNEHLRMSLALDGANAGQVSKSELLIPFDPRAMGTSILVEEWGAEGAVKAPLIISALDMGQLRLSGAGGTRRSPVGSPEAAITSASTCGLGFPERARAASSSSPRGQPPFPLPRPAPQCILRLR